MGSNGTELQVQAVLLDRRRMAVALCVSESLLDDLRARGCPCVRLPGHKKILFDPADVLAWLKTHPANRPRENMTARRATEKADAIFS